MFLLVRHTIRGVEAGIHLSWRQRHLSWIQRHLRLLAFKIRIRRCRWIDWFQNGQGVIQWIRWSNIISGLVECELFPECGPNWDSWEASINGRDHNWMDNFTTASAGWMTLRDSHLWIKLLVDGGEYQKSRVNLSSVFVSFNWLFWVYSILSCAFIKEEPVQPRMANPQMTNKCAKYCEQN